MATCIITGPGSGIGKATAIMLSHKGYYDQYALIGRNEADMRITQSEMLKSMPEGAVRLYLSDFSSPEDIPEVVNKINQEQGSIEALLNIAGYTDPKSHIESFVLLMEVQWMVRDAIYRVFSLTLSEPAILWFRSLTPGSINSFSQLKKSFVRHFKGACVPKKTV